MVEGSRGRRRNTHDLDNGMDQKHLKSNRHQPQGDLSEGFGWRLVASDWWLVAGFEGHGLGIAGIAGFVAAAESLGLPGRRWRRSQSGYAGTGRRSIGSLPGTCGAWVFLAAIKLGGCSTFRTVTWSQSRWTVTTGQQERPRQGVTRVALARFLRGF